VQYFLFGGVAFEEAGLLVLSWVVLVLLLQGTDQDFSFLQFIFLFWLCASAMPLGYFVVAVARCNWYLLDINIYSL
jgi:hypothetical protein